MAKWALLLAIISLFASALWIAPFAILYFGGPLIVYPISYYSIRLAIIFITPVAGILAALALSKPEQRRYAKLALVLVVLPTLMLIGAFVIRIFHIPYY